MKARLIVLAFVGLAGCSKAPDRVWSGWIEADAIRLTAKASGTLTGLWAERGQTLRAGQPAFGLDAEPETAAVREAEARLRRSRAVLADLERGRRPSEIAVLEAQLRQARATEALSGRESRRAQTLLRQGFVAQEQVDAALAAHERDQAKVREAEAQLATGRLAAREQQLRAAREDVASAQAQLTQAQWRLRQKATLAPVDASVEEVVYRPGEWVAAGQPVLLLLPRGSLKARFFVGEGDRARLRVGQTVQLHCDGCTRALAARVNFIAREPEFTPPVIYSQDARDKLVYRVEARLTPAADELRPGQPIDVRPAVAAMKGRP